MLDPHNLLNWANDPQIGSCTDSGERSGERESPEEVPGSINDEPGSHWCYDSGKIRHEQHQARPCPRQLLPC
jgi:hypothetical protein